MHLNTLSQATNAGSHVAWAGFKLAVYQKTTLDRRASCLLPKGFGL